MYRLCLKNNPSVPINTVKISDALATVTCVVVAFSIIVQGLSIGALRGGKEGF